MQIRTFCLSIDLINDVTKCNDNGLIFYRTLQNLLSVLYVGLIYIQDSVLDYIWQLSQ